MKNLIRSWAPFFFAQSVFIACSGRDSENIKTAHSSESSTSEFSFQWERAQAIKELESLNSIPLPAAGIAQVGASNSPIVYPPEIDNKFVFFQIARCFDELLEESEIKQWKDVLSNCSVVSETHPQTPFIDLSAPTGKWRWILRACAASGTNQPYICHESISPTRNSIKFENQNTEKVAIVTQSVHHRISVINKLTSEIQSMTLELAAAYQECDLALWKKTENLIRRSIIANVIGYGSTLLLKIYAKEITTSPESGQSWQERFGYLWKNETNDQKAIVRALLWLFTTKDDFYESCSEAEKIRVSAAYNLIKIREQHILLAGELDELEDSGIHLTEVIF